MKWDLFSTIVFFKSMTWIGRNGFEFNRLCSVIKFIWIIHDVGHCLTHPLKGIDDEKDSMHSICLNASDFFHWSPFDHWIYWHDNSKDVMAPGYRDHIIWCVNFALFIFFFYYSTWFGDGYLRSILSLNYIESLRSHWNRNAFKSYTLVQ